MNYIVQTLRRDTFLRVLTWILSSIILGTIGLLTMLSICVVVMPSIPLESTLLRVVAILAAHLLALAVPYHLLRKLSKAHGTPPPMHLTFSILVFAFTTSSGIFIFAFMLIHLALWAELVGVYWREKVQ
jgi:hypothetical protein